MKKYKVRITPDAKADLRNILAYLKNKYHNQQAVKNVWDDYIQTRKALERSAGSLQERESEQLQERGLKRINFLRHSYFMLYELEEETAVIIKVFHSLEDYENKLK